MAESKIDKSLLSFPVMFQNVEEIGNKDCRFTKVKIWLMHLGQNYNGSYFDKEVVDDAISTLQYVPIVAFIEDNKAGEKDCSDHRYIITKDEKGVRRKYQGAAYGVITSSDDNNAHYEERLCDDGETRTFLVVEGLMWNMFEDSTEIMNRDVIKNQSMELFDDNGSIEGYEDEDGIFHFTKFSFRAACILGEDYEPAMINSTVEVQFTKDFITKIQSEFNDKFIEFAKLAETKNNQGGIKTMPNTDFEQTVMEQFKDISTMVSQQETIVDRWGDSVPRFYLQDIQGNEVIVIDRKNDYYIYGFPFTMNGDKAEIDFNSGERKKVVYEKYESDDTTVVPEGAFDFGKHIEEIEDAAYEKVQDAEAKLEESEKEKEKVQVSYDKIKADYDGMKPKFDEFINAEKERLEAENEAKKDAEFAKYETALADSAEFAELKEKKSDMSLDDIVSECAIIYARKNLNKNNFSKPNNQSITSGIIENDDDDVMDGYVVTKYGNIPVGR